MLTIRGVYDGKIFRALPTESVPAVQREVPVAIIFLEDVADISHRRQYQVEVAQRMRAARQGDGTLRCMCQGLGGGRT